MKLTVVIDDHVAVQAGKRAEALGKTLEGLVSEYLQTLASDDPEKSIAELQRLSGGGNSRGQRFDRDELHRRSK
jgi:hypothetical protein